MDRVVNQRPQTLVAIKKIVCVSKEVLDKQYGSLQKKKKIKNKYGGSNKGATNQTQEVQKGGKNNFGRRKNDDGQHAKLDKPICHTCNKKNVSECWKNNRGALLVESKATLERIAQKLRKKNEHQPT